MNWKLRRIAQYETLEPRLVMSAQALTDFVSHLDTDSSLVEVEQFVETLSQDGNSDDVFGDLETIREQYNLDGKGQTIAVIDSGIAFDHLAFGEGFGAGNRVVGGYDFAENDSNPYDDGPLGLHGTHVSGIAAGNSDEFQGVAPGADLVSLRVFDDNGGGNLEWVEQALQWVHDNRNAFENPITTVNLSIGTNWNADNVPEAAQLEDEFAQLEADGIFVSVAAGNLFESFNAEGVSYPAASPFVVPVASHGSDGLLSDFSQRNDRVLVAPGENVLSTVPDFVFRGAQEDGYLRSSGTSQAAPFVAGASALLREAFENSGYENIDQDLLYEHFRETAVLVYDQSTGGHFHRINVQRAIEAAIDVMQAEPETQPDNSSEVTTPAGPVSLHNGVLTVTGTNGDDQIEFRQGSVIEVIHNGTQHQFAANQVSEILVVGAGGNDSIVASFEGQLDRAVLQVNRLDVANGQFDFVARGFESINVTAESPERQLAIRDSSGHDVVNAGFDFVTISGNGFSHHASGFDRVVVHASEGQDQISFTGSEGDDRFVVQDDRTVLRSGEQRIIGRGFDHISVVASGGEDVALLRGTEGNDHVELNGRSLFVDSGDYRVWGSGFERINAESDSGHDTIRLNGSQANDELVHRTDLTRLQSEWYVNRASGFEVVSVFGNGGDDLARIYDSVGNDAFFSQGNQANFTSGFDNLNSIGFETVNVYAENGGYDSATIIGTEGSDQIVADASSTRFTNVANIETSVDGFDLVTVDARGGHDVSQLIGSEQRDVLRSLENGLEFESTVQLLRMVNAESHVFEGNGGVDEAIFADFDSLDLLTGLGDGATAFLDGQQIEAREIEFLEARVRENQRGFYDFGAVDYLFQLNGDWQEAE